MIKYMRQLIILLLHFYSNVLQPEHQIVITAQDINILGLHNRFI